MGEFLHTMWQIFTENFHNYMEGTGYTLLISLTGTLIGLVIGLLVGIVRTIPTSKVVYKQRLLAMANRLLNGYVAIFRGTPMIVQATVVYYGTSILWQWDLSPLQAAFLVVSVNTGAYLSEVVRGGIYSVDKGQFEAARAIGMNHWQAMTNVVMPQVFRHILPSVGNEFVINIKDTSVLSVIAVNELYFTTSTISSTNYLFFETFLVTAIIYFALTYTVTLVLRAIEKRLDGNVTIESTGANQQQVATIEKGGNL